MNIFQFRLDQDRIIYEQGLFKVLYGYINVINNQNVNKQGTISIGIPIVYLSCLYTTQWNVQDIVSFTRSRVWDESHDRIGTQNNP